MRAVRWLAVLGLLPPLAAHDPITTKITWAKEISRLFERRCMSCHQNGGRAPFPLTTYEEARPWAVAIREETTLRAMPPWNAVRGFGSFRDDPSLTQEEIQLIAEWVNGGAPEGDPVFLSGRLPKAWQEAGTHGLTARRMGELAALQVRGLPQGAALRVFLLHPDSSAIPLVWIRGFQPSAGSVFLLERPLPMPHGARLVTEPASLARHVVPFFQPPRPSASPSPAPVAESAAPPRPSRRF
jgi:hypothetical protein